MNGKHSVARRVARRRNGGDAGRDLRARLEAVVPGDIRKYPSLVAEGKLQIRRRSSCAGKFSLLECLPGSEPELAQVNASQR